MGRVGDGWLVSGATPREVREGAEMIFDTAAEYGRTIEEDHIGALVGYYVSSSAEETAAQAYQYVTRHRPDAHFTEYSALGPAGQVAEVIQGYIDAGASKIVVRPLCQGDQTVEQLDIMGSEILPLFHK